MDHWKHTGIILQVFPLGAPWHFVFGLLELTLLLLCVLVRWYCVTDHPKKEWLKTTTFYLAYNSVGQHLRSDSSGQVTWS